MSGFPPPMPMHEPGDRGAQGPRGGWRGRSTMFWVSVAIRVGFILVLLAGLLGLGRH